MMEKQEINRVGVEQRNKRNKERNRNKMKRGKEETLKRRKST